MGAEFYCNASAGSNLNSGYPIGGIYPVTTTNGAYTQGGGAGGGTSDRFTAAAGTPFSDIAVGDYVSIYNDAAAAPTPYVVKITAINAGGASIDVDSTKKSGTRATTVGSGKTAKVGGEWKGPNGASQFPFNFVTSTMADPFITRVNFKNNANYSITAQMTHTSGVAIFSGYTNTSGDGGRAIIDGGTVGASYILFNAFTGITLIDMIFQNNGSTGSANGLGIGSQVILCRVTVHDVKGSGFTHSSNIRKFLVECEAYNCGVNGFVMGSRANLIRCYSHNNTGVGFAFAASNGDCLLLNCIADSNAGGGITSGCGPIKNCDIYNSTGGGIVTQETFTITTIENCNLVKNTVTGVTVTGGMLGQIYNCGFGSGSDINTSGQISIGSTGGIVSGGSITYGSPTNPWNAPTTGDFRIANKKAFNAGVGTYQQNGGKSGTVDYPDIGSAQHKFIPPRKIV